MTTRRILSPDVLASARRGRRDRPGLVLGVLTVALLTVVVLSIGIGQYSVPPSAVLAALAERAHLGLGLSTTTVNSSVVWDLRLPRAVLGMLVGGSLAGGGALLQGVFANPLAEPGIIGVSSGAAVGASLAIAVFGLGAATFAVAGLAFAGGLVAVGLVYVLGFGRGKSMLNLILTGIAVNAVAGGLIAYLTLVASPTDQGQIVFWQLGSLDQATWSADAIVLPFFVIGIAGALYLSERVDLLSLGEPSARALGVDVVRVRRLALLFVALLAAGAVAFCGIILFVGLVIPHIARLLVGARQRVLISLSVVMGAGLLTLADLLARSLIAYTELPIGMITSIVGGPVFLLLLRRASAAAS